MINLNKHRIDFGKGDVGIGVIGNTTDSAQLALRAFQVLCKQKKLI